MTTIECVGKNKTQLSETHLSAEIGRHGALPQSRYIVANMHEIRLPIRLGLPAPRLADPTVFASPRAFFGDHQVCVYPQKVVLRTDHGLSRETFIIFYARVIPIA